MAQDSQTCCTVETPSRLMLFYPDSIPSAVATLLPDQPICKPVGHHVILGRSGSADVRLNDERMSRQYAALWHDGKDPFIFRVSNLSERKLLLVDGNMVRYKEEAEVKDGSVLIMDFLEFKAKVCGGDYVSFTFQISFIRNVVMSPPVSQKPPEGKCLMPARRNSNSGKNLLSNSFVCQDQRGRASTENVNDVVSRLLTCLHTGSLDSGMGMSDHSRNSYATGRSLSNPEDYVGIEYELPENISTMSTGYPATDGDKGLSDVGMPSSGYPASHKLSLNIPTPGSVSAGQFMATTASATPERPNLFSPEKPPNQSYTPSTTKKNLSCWFNVDSAPLQQNITLKENTENSFEYSQETARHTPNVLQTPTSKVCPSFQECGCNMKRPATLKPSTETIQKLALADMVPQSGSQRSPVEHAEWDTDDPNINSYM